MWTTLLYMFYEHSDLVEYRSTYLKWKKLNETLNHGRFEIEKWNIFSLTKVNNHTYENQEPYLFVNSLISVR